MMCANQNCLAEWSYRSSKQYKDPFRDIALHALVTDPEGRERKVPAFWAGDSTWRIR